MGHLRVGFHKIVFLFEVWVTFCRLVILNIMNGILQRVWNCHVPLINIELLFSRQFTWLKMNSQTLFLLQLAQQSLFKKNEKKNKSLFRFFLALVSHGVFIVCICSSRVY